VDDVSARGGGASDPQAGTRRATTASGTSARLPMGMLILPVLYPAVPVTSVFLTDRSRARQPVTVNWRALTTGTSVARRATSTTGSSG
jgi:hypothetical protein